MEDLYNVKSIGLPCQLTDQNTSPTVGFGPFVTSSLAYAFIVVVSVFDFDNIN